MIFKLTVLTVDNDNDVLDDVALPVSDEEFVTEGSYYDIFPEDEEE